MKRSLLNSIPHVEFLQHFRRVFYAIYAISVYEHATLAVFAFYGVYHTCVTGISGTFEAVHFHNFEIIGVQYYGWILEATQLLPVLIKFQFEPAFSQIVRGLREGVIGLVHNVMFGLKVHRILEPAELKCFFNLNSMKTDPENKGW